MVEPVVNFPRSGCGGPDAGAGVRVGSKGLSFAIRQQTLQVVAQAERHLAEMYVRPSRVSHKAGV